MKHVTASEARKSWFKLLDEAARGEIIASQRNDKKLILRLERRRRSVPRLVVDEVAFVAVCRKALTLSWPRDPFDRLICAHRLMRRVPLCSLDTAIHENHELLVPDLRM